MATIDNLNSYRGFSNQCLFSLEFNTREDNLRYERKTTFGMKGRQPSVREEDNLRYGASLILKINMLHLGLHLL